MNNVVSLNEAFEREKNKIESGAYIIFGDKVFKLLESNLMPSTASAIRQQLTSSLYELKYAYENALISMRKDYEKKAQEAFRAGLMFHAQVREVGKWKLEVADNYNLSWILTLTYEDKIQVKYLMMEGQTIPIPKQYEGKFDIRKVKLYIDNEMKIIAASAEGYNPHISSANQLCIGRYRGQKVSPEVLQKIVKSLEIAVIDEGWDNAARAEARLIFNEANATEQEVIWNNENNDGGGE